MERSTCRYDVAVSILDKLLESGKITIDQYLKNLPSEYLQNNDLSKEVKGNE